MTHPIPRINKPIESQRLSNIHSQYIHNTRYRRIWPLAADNVGPRDSHLDNRVTDYIIDNEFYTVVATLKEFDVCKDTDGLYCKIDRSTKSVIDYY